MNDSVFTFLLSCLESKTQLTFHHFQEYVCCLQDWESRKNL